MKKNLRSNPVSSAVLLLTKCFFSALIIALLFVPQHSLAQSNADKSSDTTTTVTKTTYPKVVGYLSFIFPLVTYSDGGFTHNFNGSTSIGFPVGINVLYSDKF